MSDTETLTLSLREMRLIFERLVQAAGAPAGLLPAVRDCAFYSAILPNRGFAGIESQVEALRSSRPAPLSIVSGAEIMTIDCSGQHAWFAAQTLLDLAIEQFRLTGKGELVALNLEQADELRVVAGLSEPFGLTAATEAVGNGIQLTIMPRLAASTSLLDSIRRTGFAVSAALWWPLYHASHDALAPDSFESRRHAGTIRVEADGRITGRNDEDETDLAMLAPDPSRLRSDPVPSIS